MDFDISNFIVGNFDSLVNFIGLNNIHDHYFHYVWYTFFGHLVFFLFARYIVFSKIYRFNIERKKTATKILVVLNVISFCSWSFADLTHNHEQIKEILSIFTIIYLSKFVFHICSYINVQLHGKVKDYYVDVTNFIKSNKLRSTHKNLILKSKAGDEKKVELDLSFTYYKDDDKVVEKISTKISTKTTKIIDVIIFITILVFSISLIIPLIGDLSSYLKNSYILVVVGFIFVYALQSVYPNLYGAFLVIKNEHIDKGDFIRIKEKNIKGRVVDVDWFQIKLKDHVRKTIITIPASFFHQYMVENLSKFESPFGKKEVLDYVLDIKLYESDKGDRLRLVFQQILDYMDASIDHVYKGDEHSIWFTPDDDGIKITIWYYVKDIEREEKVKLDVEEYVLYYCTEHNIDLRTPKLLDIVSAKSLNSKFPKKRGE